MEAATDQSNSPVGGSLLRYPLQSATRAKEAKPSNDEPHVTSTTRRLRTTQNVAKSMSELDLTGKERSVKPPRRFNKPSNSSPLGIPTGNLTPISEKQRNKLNDQLNNETPTSDATKSSHRRKFCVLSSASYWLTQIKLSESTSKHSVSIGFFKLALESGVEPLHRIREELKSYVLKHNLLAELENMTKDILNSYNIQDLEKLHILESSSQLSEEVTLNSSEVAKNSATAPSARNSKLKLLSRDTLSESNKNDAIQKKPPIARKKPPTLRNPETAVLMNDLVCSSALATTQQPRKLQMSKAKSNNKCSEKNFSSEVDDSLHEQPKLDDKENMVAENMDIYSSK